MAKLVVKRYATALFDLAASEGAMAKYEEEVKVIVKALHDEPDFMAVLQDHKVTTEDKIKVVEMYSQIKLVHLLLGYLF